MRITHIRCTGRKRNAMSEWEQNHYHPHTVISSHGMPTMAGFNGLPFLCVVDVLCNVIVCIPAEVKIIDAGKKTIAIKMDVLAKNIKNL